MIRLHKKDDTNIVHAVNLGAKLLDKKSHRDHLKHAFADGDGRLLFSDGSCLLSVHVAASVERGYREVIQSNRTECVLTPANTEGEYPRVSKLFEIEYLFGNYVTLGNPSDPAAIIKAHPGFLDVNKLMLAINSGCFHTGAVPEDAAEPVKLIGDGVEYYLMPMK